MMNVFRSATVGAPPVLEYAVKLFKLTNDVLTPEAQKKLSSYFQAAVNKRSRLHLTETDEYITGNGEGTVSTAYRKMKSLCLNIRNEIYTDIEIQSCNILPSFLDLSNLSSSMYSAKLSSRLEEFLFAHPPHAPSRHVADLVIATADFQKDLASWNVKSWVDAKDLFHKYILIWIEANRKYLLKTCEGDEVAKWSGARTQRSATQFVDGIYDKIKNTINDYEVILSRWPEYTFTLENAVTDIQKAVIEALDKRYADVLAPLKPQKSVLKFLQKLNKTETPYTAPPKLGMLLNSMKKMLDVLCPEIELRLRPWGSSCIPDDGNVAAGERLSEVTAMLRSKFKSYLRMVAQKLVENTRLQKDTKIKKILQDSKKTDRDFEIQTRMQPLVEQLTSSMVHLDMILERSVFISACREYWDQMGQDVLGCLQKWKENPEWYKGSTVAVTTCVQILDETFVSQMQQLLGNTLEEKDHEPPTSMVEVQSFILGC